jgi:hypothetical protein
MNRRQAVLTIGGCFLIPGSVTRKEAEAWWPYGNRKPEGRWVDISHARSAVIRDTTISVGRKGLRLENCYLNNAIIIVEEESGPFQMLHCVVDLREDVRGRETLIRFKRPAVEGEDMINNNIIYGRGIRP